MSNKISKSKLESLIREIVKHVVKNMKEETGTSAVSPVTGPNAFKKTQQPPIEEGTDAATPGYNVPGWLSRKGGSKAGVAGSETLGYTLTDMGKKEMNRPGDRLLENKKKK